MMSPNLDHMEFIVVVALNVLMSITSCSGWLGREEMGCLRRAVMPEAFIPF